MKAMRRKFGALVMLPESYSLRIYVQFCTSVDIPVSNQRILTLRLRQMFDWDDRI